MASKHGINDSSGNANIDVESRPDTADSLESIIGNMMLAHEMIVNDDFSLKEVPENT